MADNKVNVKFLRGSQAGLDALNGYEAGAFYLTEDTHRLYAANDVGTAIDLLSQSIVFVASTSDLPAAVKVAGQLYYVTGQNILCTWDSVKSEWKQINPDTDTIVNSVSYTVSGSSNAIDLKTNVGLVTKGGEAAGTKTSGAVTFKGAGDITVTSSGNDIIFTDKQYDIEVGDLDSDNKGVTVNLKKGSNVAGSFKLKTEGGIAFGKDAANDAVVINATTQQPEVDNSLTAEAQGFKSTVKVGNSSKSATIDPLITYGADGDETVHFENGTATLDVYTKGEVDEIYNEIDALKYKGIVNSASELPSSNVEIGWMYKVGTAFSSGSVDYKVNDLLIANGTEEDGVIVSNLHWDHISCADGVDTKYNFAASGTKVILKENGSADVGELEVVGDGTYLSAAGTVSGNGKNNKVTVSHIANGTAGTKGDGHTGGVSGLTTALAGVGYKAVTGVTVDAAGHVTGVTEDTLTVRDTTLASGSGSAAGSAEDNVASVTLTAKIKDTANTEVSANMSFSVGSDSLEVAEDTAGAITVDLVWGRF